MLPGSPGHDPTTPFVCVIVFFFYFLPPFAIPNSFLPSLLLGSLLALSFCPSTASIFFGIMVPVSVRHEAPIVIPLVYSAGAVVPLVIISILVRTGLSGLLPQFWLKLLPQIAGGVLIAVGIYITLRQLYF